MKNVKVPEERWMSPKGKDSIDQALRGLCSTRRISHMTLFSPWLMPPSTLRRMLTWAAKEKAGGCPDAINSVHAKWSLRSERGLQARQSGCDPHFTSYPGNPVQVTQLSLVLAPSVTQWGQYLSPEVVLKSHDTTEIIHLQCSEQCLARGKHSKKNKVGCLLLGRKIPPKKYIAAHLCF